MGIRGLLSVILDRKSECSQTVDLIQVAKERGGIEILVDFYSFRALDRSKPVEESRSLQAQRVLADSRRGVCYDGRFRWQSGAGFEKSWN
ncbi:hypothetical protein BaRGS_00022612 [Batillaria attramentaria]|uniref:Photolyase/cryptochrome alpha/beta domain-containing protein n=1 Tax=Batillaria attramentaria TaxID=370345 RepID=A0ABD0KG15_9CAEN